MKEFLVFRCKMCRYSAVVDPEDEFSTLIMAKPNTNRFESMALECAMDLHWRKDELLDAGFQICEECSVVAIVTERRGLFHYEEVK